MWEIQKDLGGGRGGTERRLGVKVRVSFDIEAFFPFLHSLTVVVKVPNNTGI